MDAGTEQFFSAIKNGDKDTVRAALKERPELVQAKVPGGPSSVLLASYYGQPEIAQLLIENGAPLDLFEASATGQVERVAEIIDLEPDLSNAYAPDGFQPLGLASFFGHLEVVELLLARGAQVNSPSRNNMRVQPLHSAAASGKIEIVKLLLEHGADPNARQSDDFTPIQAAEQNKDAAMKQLLLDYGALAA